MLVSSVSPLESMRSGDAITPPPPKRGISAILARHPTKTRQNACDTPPLRYYLERALRDFGGVFRTGPLSPSLAKKATSKNTQVPKSQLRPQSHCFYGVFLKRVTLLVGTEKSLFRYRDFSIFFSVSRSCLTSNFAGCRGPEEHARVDLRKKTT